MKKLILGIALFSLFTSNLIADNCQTWNWDEVPIEMKTCVRSGGGSGYINFKNNSPKAIKICWTLIYFDGRRSKGCKLNFEGYDNSSSSEYHLSVSKLKSIQLTKFKYN